MAAGQQMHADPRDLFRTTAADRDALGGGRSASSGRSTTSEADAHFVVRREEEKNKTKHGTTFHVHCLTRQDRK